MTMLMCQVCNDNDNRDDASSASSVEEDIPAEIYVSLLNEDSADEYGCYCLPTNDCPARPLGDEGEGTDVTHQDLEALRRMAREVIEMRALQDRPSGHRHAKASTTPGLGGPSTSSSANSLPPRPDTPRPNYRGDGPVRRQAPAAPPAARPVVPPRRATDSPDHPSYFSGAGKGGSFGMLPLPFVVRRNPDGTLA